MKASLRTIPYRGGKGNLLFLFRKLIFAFFILHFPIYLSTQLFRLNIRLLLKNYPHIGAAKVI